VFDAPTSEATRPTLPQQKPQDGIAKDISLVTTHNTAASAQGRG